MKGRAGAWLLLPLLAALLAGLLLLHAPGAGAVQVPVVEPTPADEPGQAGKMTVIVITGDQVPPQGVPLPSSWRDIELEKCEPSEEDWVLSGMPPRISQRKRRPGLLQKSERYLLGSQRFRKESRTTCSGDLGGIWFRQPRALGQPRDH